ncbi:hypothetical protein MANES_15G058801v8 [Manihot esculenta]|uniref:Uncharacterized protein n=1 Tax=Manihot esculenta TaxID=3983 RepID=A0ACB7G9H1_MANES|nr:hypothetical protein MANES_15G058801v8 [Manihot esculenta]
MDYLEFLYSCKENTSRIYDVCKTFYRVEKHDRTLTSYFMDFKRVYEELKVLIPFSIDVKTQQAQREQMAVMSFLASLPLEFETAKSHILFDSKISSLHYVFTKVLRTESPIPSHTTSALVSRNDNGRHDNKSGHRRGFNGGRRSQRLGKVVPTSDSGGIICYYCREPGHTKKTCLKLQNKNQCSQMTHMAVEASPDQGILISADEYAQFTQYQASLKFSNSSITAIAKSGNSIACLVFLSSKWVIDSGTTDHMLGNSTLLSNLKSHASSS